MALELNVECRRCGKRFKQYFDERPYDRTMKCPSCSSLALALIEGFFFDRDDERDVFGPWGPGVKVKTP